MQRRSIAPGGADLESAITPSQDSIEPTSSKSGTSAALTDRALQDETGSKFFPMIILLMELSYHFVKASSEVYSVYALGGYTSTLEQLDAIELIIKYRYLGALAVLPVGIVCDSYIGTFYPLLFFLCVLTAFMGLHAFISLPWMFMTASTKLLLAHLTFPIFALFHIVEPLKLVIISRAIMESNYFRFPRRFYAMLACALNLGIGAGGTVLYFSTKSRNALCTIMFANFFLMIMNIAFYMVARRQFLRNNSPRKMETFGVVEKALAVIICTAFKYVDRYLLRKLIFKQTSGVTGDFRCFTSSQNARRNARAIVGIALVTLPLIAALTMLVIIDLFYYVQLSMFYYYPTDPFPLLSLKGYLFLLMFPLMEFCIFPSLKKWTRTEASRLLALVGVGALCVSVCLCWSYVVYKVVRGGNDFWYNFPAGTGHIAITNCLNVPVYIRSQYINYIQDYDAGWTVLPPFKTSNILNVPEEHIPFHFEFSNTELAIHDEYYLPVRVGQCSWYLILPNGVYPFPPYCYRRNQRHIVMTSSFYGPATVCVVCALTLCNGYARFAGSSGLYNAQVNLVPLTGRGTNDSIAYDKIMTELVGESTISAILGGAIYTGSSTIVSFTRTDTFMVVVYDGLSNNSNWENDREVAQHSVEPTDDSDLIKIFFWKTSPRSTFNVAWMYPTVVFHALADVTYMVSLWMFLFTHSPDQIRTTTFCFVEVLGVPAYAFLYKKGAMSLRWLKPMDYFYLAGANCFFIILYFFCTLFFTHKLFKENPAHRSSVEVTLQRRQNVMPERLDEQKEN